MSEQARLDAQIVLQVVELGLSAQLEDADTIDVEVDTNLLKVVQGQLVFRQENFDGLKTLKI
jgi:hypothetical protein